ncbi:MAG: insulinase family protein [Opitutales bacterium]|jgi:zinc protease
MIASKARFFAAFTALSLIALSQSFAAAETETKALWPQDVSDLAPDPSVVWGVLPNGVRYAIMPHAEPPGRASMRLYVNAGSLMETDGQRGIAHFLEHMAFNGTTHHEPGSMVEYFQRLGMGFGNDTNAHTSWNETVYLLELPAVTDAMMDDSMQMLRDYAHGMLFLQSEVDRERGVILAEKRDRDTVQYRMFVDGLKFSLPDALMPERFPIGQEADISAFDSAAFHAFYDKWYTPDRMVVVVAGDMEPGRAKAYIEKYFSDLPPVADAQADPDMGSILPRGTVARILREPEAPAVDIGISNIRQLAVVPDGSAERAAAMARSLANAMIERRLEILAKLDGAPFVGGSAYTFHWMDFVDCSEIDLTCPPERWKDALAVAEQQIRKALEFGFTQAELDEAKANMLNSYEQAVKKAPTRKSARLAEAICRSISDHEVFTSPEQDLELASAVLENIGAGDVLGALREAWSGDTRIIYVSGKLPEDAGDEAALDAYKAGAAVAVEPPEQVEAASFAYTEFGEPGKVVSFSKVEDMGITQLVLSNNVCLNLKPTDFEKNVVRVAVRFGSGVLEAPGDKPGLPMLANLTFIGGGLTKHSADDLARIFAGRNVGVNFSVQSDSFVLSGATSTRDLQDELDLLTAYVVAPGYRDEALRQARKTIPQIYMQVLHTPEGVLQNEAAKFLANGDDRMGYPKQEDLEERNLDGLREWLSGPLSHGRMEVSIVGDFKEEDAVTLVARTFGALPARDTVKPEFVEQRVMSMPAAQTKAFDYETELPKAVSMFVWPTEDIWDISRTRRFSVLSDIVTDRLRVELREKLGEAYSPYAFNAPSDTFKGYGYLACISTVAPDKLGQVADLVRQVGADIAADGVTQDELDRALKPMFEQVTEWRRNNNYWLGNVLASSQEFPARIEWARSMVGDLRSISTAQIDELAKTYLQPDRAIDVRVFPATAPAAATGPAQPVAEPAAAPAEEPMPEPAAAPAEEPMPEPAAAPAQADVGPVAVPVEPAPEPEGR